jgi:hypothetical protein
VPKILIDVPGLAGEYEMVPLPDFTLRDWHTVKELSGLRPLEVEEGLQKLDLDLLLAITVVTLRRAGKAFQVDQLWETKPGAIQFDFTEETPSPPPVSGSDAANAASTVSSNGSGAASPATGHPNGSGIPGSDTGAPSDPLISAI